MSEQSSTALSARIAALGAQLRARGSRVGVGEVIVAHRALGAVDCGSRADSRLALRTVLCSCREDLARFDDAFAAVFGTAPSPSEAPLKDLGLVERAALPRTAIPADRAPDPAAEQRRPVPAAWSELELLRDKDFADLSDAEYALAQELIRGIARRGPRRSSRRSAPVTGRGRLPDLRRTVRGSLRTGGEPLHRHWRGPTTRPRPLVLVCDVSGSMTPYARMLMQYMHACVAARRRIEAFAFGTRLTRVTGELAGQDHDRALQRAVEATADFSGGTRIGEALAQLNRQHGRRLGRGAVVVILSDGWDRGEPELLAAEMARLRRSAHRLVWLNPLAASPQYEPLTRGMRAAIPHADELLAGNSVASLEQLAVLLEQA